MQVLAFLVLLLSQLANVANAIPLLVSSPPMLALFNHSGHPRAALMDVVAQLGEYYAAFVASLMSSSTSSPFLRI